MRVLNCRSIVMKFSPVPLESSPPAVSSVSFQGSRGRDKEASASSSFCPYLPSSLELSVILHVPFQSMDSTYLVTSAIMSYSTFIVSSDLDLTNIYFKPTYFSFSLLQFNT
jgi:hypothetical protein